MSNATPAPKTSKPVCIGLSDDGRTNRWRITCPACEKPFEPRTTRFAVQELTCPASKCSVEMVARYNDDIVILRQD